MQTRRLSNVTNCPAAALGGAMQAFERFENEMHECGIPLETILTVGLCVAGEAKYAGTLVLRSQTTPPRLPQHASIALAHRFADRDQPMLC